jgi:hypothetical protein
MMKVLFRVLKSIVQTFLNSVFRPKRKVEKINIEIDFEQQTVDIELEKEGYDDSKSDCLLESSRTEES